MKTNILKKTENNIQKIYNKLINAWGTRNNKQQLNKN